MNTCQAVGKKKINFVFCPCFNLPFLLCCSASSPPSTFQTGFSRAAKRNHVRSFNKALIDIGVFKGYKFQIMVRYCRTLLIGHYTLLAFSTLSKKWLHPPPPSLPFASIHWLFKQRHLTPELEQIKNKVISCLIAFSWRFNFLCF